MHFKQTLSNGNKKKDVYTNTHESVIHAITMLFFLTLNFSLLLLLLVVVLMLLLLLSLR